MQFISIFRFANMKNSLLTLFIGAFFFSVAVFPVHLSAGDAIANGELSKEIPAPPSGKDAAKEAEPGKKMSFTENIKTKFKGKVKSAAKKIKGSMMENNLFSGFLDDAKCPTGIKGVNINVSERKDGIIIEAAGSSSSANILLQQLVSFYMPDPGIKHQVRSMNFGGEIISGVKNCFNADISNSFLFYQSDSSITAYITGNDDKTAAQIKKAAASWRSLKNSRHMQKTK